MRILILFLLLHISVVIFAQVVSNQTYTSNTTISGCNVTLENVAVENGSKLTVNSKDQLSISGTLNLNGSGSVLEIQTPALMAPILDPTNAVSLRKCNSATSGGSISCDGGATVSERGVCWATTSNPTTANSKVTSGTGTGTYTGNLTGLLPNTTYYVRSYAINSAGTGYGSQITLQLWR